MNFFKILNILLFPHDKDQNILLRYPLWVPLLCIFITTVIDVELLLGNFIYYTLISLFLLIVLMFFLCFLFLPFLKYIVDYFYHLILQRLNNENSYYIDSDSFVQDLILLSINITSRAFIKDPLVQFFSFKDLPQKKRAN
jgi:hypothetical protein